MFELIDIIKDALIDTLKLIPFLFITYLIMEYIENKTGEKAKEKIKKTGKCGPLVGSMLGVIPQCGFSASCTNLYSSKLITIGTLMAVYLSTSDEMVPILISKSISTIVIIKILLIKLILGIIFGFLIDFIFRKFIYSKNTNEEETFEICEKEHCECHEKGIIIASLIHTINIVLYIFIITLVINLLVSFLGEERLEIIIKENKLLGPVFSSLIGLIPNCAASVIITNFYTSGIINIASLISGLLTGAGVGLIVLFKTNAKKIKENISIAIMLYAIGVLSGFILQLINIDILF